MEKIFYLATPLLIISGLPQMIKLLRRKSAKDISLATYSLTTFAVILLFANSIQVGDWSLILANGSSGLITTTNTILILYFSKNDQNSRMRNPDAPR